MTVCPSWSTCRQSLPLIGLAGFLSTACSLDAQLRAGESESAQEPSSLTDTELQEAAEKDPSICLPGVPGTSQLPRLNRVQYDNTIFDLVGVGGEPSAMLAPDSAGSVDQRGWEGYQLAAASVAEQVVADPSLMERLLPCSPEGDGSACAQQLIRAFGTRAFRRPLTEEEASRFNVLVHRRAELTGTGSFDELVQLIVEAFLLSPSFLMRPEIAEVPEGEYWVLSGYEIASRLSYLLWNSMPDEPLFAAAGAGELDSAEGILKQAQRMIADERARDTVRRFHEHYLHMGPGTRWADILRSPDAYPNYREALGPLLSEETLFFVEHVVFALSGTFQDLLLEPTGFVNAELAPLYGLDAGSFGTELVAVELEPSTRAGLFTRLGFLASHSYFDRSSPIHRGAFIQKDVLCEPIGTPPPGAEGQELPTEGLATNRERVDAQTGEGPCRSCHHEYINPTGFAFEAYDAIGALQTSEWFSGAPIDSHAQVLLDGKLVDVAGPVELSQRLAESPSAHACYAKKWVEFAYSRALNNQDACLVDELSARLTAGGYTILQLIVDLTQSESFRFRTLEKGPSQ